MSHIDDLLKQMTLEEKAVLCIGASAWTTTPIERLGVPEMIVSDGPHGVRRVPDVNSMANESLPATCFPTASCLASTWDVDLLRQMGEALAEECIALNEDAALHTPAPVHQHAKEDRALDPRLPRERWIDRGFDAQ